MVFGFKHVVVQGSLPEVEGAAEFIQEFKSFAESIGWTTEDDRTSQPGSASAADTHKIVFKSNGEAGGYPNFYMTVFSGSGAAAGLGKANFMMHTAYDVGTHDVPASGVSTQPVRTTACDLQATSDSDVEYWMSGDSEAIAIVSKDGSTYDSMMAGRANSFMTVDENPYPLYINAVATNVITVTTTYARVVAGQPPQEFVLANEADMTSLPLATTNQPYQFGGATSIFLAVPILINLDDLNPIRKGVIGTVRNAWMALGTGSGMNQESRLTASGTDGEQIYRAFPSGTTQSLVMRES